MDPENQASLIGRNRILARGTDCSAAGRWGITLLAVNWSNQAMTAAPSGLMEAMGTARALLHASTAASSDSRSCEGYPARASSSATRSRLPEGSDGSGACPVDACTQRLYGTGSPTPRIQN